MMSVISLLIGLVIVNEYNVWNMTVPFLLTLVGWVMIIRGILGLFVPQLMVRIMSHRTFLQVWGVVPLVVGLILCWYSFSPQ